MSILLFIWKKLPKIHTLHAFLLRRVNDQFLIGVTGVIFNDKNEVLLLKHTYRRVPWSLPGGYLQTKEHPKVGLAREIEEETGFVVKVVRIIMTKTNHKGHLDISYFGVLDSGEFRESSEVSHYKFVSVENLPKLIDDQYEQISVGLERKVAFDRKHRWDKATAILKRAFSFH
jgi:8-oxo-dGTP diphosphatase